MVVIVGAKRESVGVKRESVEGKREKGREKIRNNKKRRDWCIATGSYDGRAMAEVPEGPREAEAEHQVIVVGWRHRSFLFLFLF